MALAQPAPNATTQIRTGAGFVRKIAVQAAAAVTCDVYDNTATTGTPIFTVPASAPVGTVYNLDFPFALGLRVVIGAGLQLSIDHS